jgi:phosphomannomutase / phosphoglucomutase
MPGKLSHRMPPGRRLILALVAALLLIAAAVLTHAWIMQRTAAQSVALQAAEQGSRALSTYTSLLRSHSEDLAKALASQGITAQARSTFPGVESTEIVRVGRLGLADPAFDPHQLRNNIEMHLVGQVAAGATPGPEAYQSSGRWLLAMAVAIPGNETANGVLLVRANLATIEQSILPETGITAELSLWARAADGSFQPVGAERVHAPGHRLTRIATQIAPIHSGFSTQPGITDGIPFGILPVLLLIGAAGAALAGLILFCFRTMTRNLREDSLKLTELALRQRSATASVPTLHFEHLSDLGDALVKLRRELQTGAGRSRETGHSAQPAARDELQDALEITDPVVDAAGAGEPPPEIPARLFRDYDIRGLAVELTPALARAIGQAVGSEALDRGRSSVVVGTDGRHSSPALREHLVGGLLASGCDVIDIGTVATPMLYFACHHLQGMTGVMVTGSHNPADHNGFKIMIDGETLCGERIGLLRQRIIEKRFHSGQGSYTVSEIDSLYIKAVAEDVLVDAPHRVVVDCGNGAASVIAVDLFRELGCEVVPLFCELDGSFPNHHPDPCVPENLNDLIAKVRQHGAVAGIAFDGDADRIGIVSASGAIITADRLMMLFARDLLLRNPGAEVVFDVKCSRNLPAVIAGHGGRPIMCRSGHSWIKEKMKETGALLGGEFTGHICFRDRWFGFDDALYAAARLLEIMTAENSGIDELLAELPNDIATPEIHLAVGEEQKFALMETIAQGIRFDDAHLVRIDGVRAEFGDGWGLIRASNTTGALVCRFEASDKPALQRIQAAFRAELRRLLPDTDVTI